MIRVITKQIRGDEGCGWKAMRSSRTKQSDNPDYADNAIKCRNREWTIPATWKEAKRRLCIRIRRA